MISRVTDRISDYTADSFFKDGRAGLTVAMLAIPQCMAYAIIAGLKPVYGLYAAITACFVGSVVGSSSRMITGPAGKLCLVVGGVIYGIETATPIAAAMTLALMVGILQIIFASLKLGNLSRFVSNAVMNGFIMGGGLVIIGDQFINLFGITKQTSPFFIKRALGSFQEVLYTSYEFPVLSFSVGIATIIFIYGLRKLNRNIPASLLAIIIAGICTYLLGGRSAAGLETIQNVSLKSFQTPSFNVSQMVEMFSGALATTLLATVQAVSISKSLARQSLESVNENQDLVGQGAANIACGVLSGFPVTGSLSRSFFNHSLGAQTRMSGILSSIFMLLVVGFFSSLMVFIPKPVLYGLIIVAMKDVFDWEELQVSLTATRRDQVAFLCTFLSVLVLKLDWAIYAGVAVSLVLYIRKATRLDLKEYIVDETGQLKQITDYEDRIEPDLAFIDVNGETFFGSADQIKERIEKICTESDDIKVIILRMKNAMNLDITGAMVLKDIAQMLKERKKTLMVSGATPQIREVLQEAGVAEVIGQDKILVAQKSLLASSRQAIDRARAHIDSVLEGSTSREEEEDHPTQHTLERLEEVVEEPEEELQETSENPVEEEKVQPPSDEELSDEQEDESSEENDRENES
jgi:SulP family sulfate permease